MNKEIIGYESPQAMEIKFEIEQAILTWSVEDMEPGDGWGIK